jgi:glutamate decarboxylase
MPLHRNGPPGDDLQLRPEFARPGETSTVPRTRIPDGELEPDTAYQLVHDELMLDGNARLNLATFVTTWMEPQARTLIGECLAKNMIDKDEYPQTAELERRCVNMLAALWGAEDAGEATGCSTTGSSEACMLGGMALKWRWRARREAAGRPADRPNLVMGANVQVCWEKFCRYWEVEPRLVPVSAEAPYLTADAAAAHCDENTIGVVAILGSTMDGSYEPVQAISAALDRLERDTGVHVPMHVDAASGGFVAPFLDPDLVWDFRLPRVASINASGHKYGLVYPGVGWLIFRERADLADDLVFYENYLGKRDATFTLNFSTGSAMVVAQYYNFVRYGYDGYSYIMHTMQANSRKLAEDIAAIGEFSIIGAEDAEQLPLVAFQLAGEQTYDEFDIAAQLASERGWMVPAYTLPPDADHIKIMRALVKETLGRSLTTALAEDIAQACATLKQKGRVHETERARVHTSTGY